MRVCLIKPFSTRRHDVEQYHIDIGLGFLGTALKKRGHQVKVLDCLLQRIGPKEFPKFLRSNISQVYGFKVYSHGVNIVKEAIKLVKLINPESKVIVGGPHPSGVRGEIFSFFPQVDYGFQGEAEIGLPQLIDVIKEPAPCDLENIPGLIWKKDGDAVCNPPFFTTDLDSLGYPDWDLLDMENYWKRFKHIRFMAGSYVPVITSRGCPYSCTFCEAQNLSGRKIREHSIDYVMEWIRHLKKKYGINNFAFVDDALTVNKPRFIQICEEILRRDFKIKWDCASNGIRWDNLDSEMLRLMERAGCFYINVAIESGSKRILQDMRKPNNLELLKEKLNLIKQVTNIFVEGNFILGYPTELEQNVKQTIKFAKQLNLDAAIFTLFTPHPGTTVTEQLKKEGKLDSIDYNNSYYDEPSIPLIDVSKDKLKSYRRYAYWTFFVRPRISLKFVLKYLNSLKNFIPFIRIIIRYLVK